MSDLPAPLYRIGDVAYFPTVEQTTEQLPCPDCLGTRIWKLLTPAGTECEVRCPRCVGGYSTVSDHLPSLSVTRYTPSVRAVTIRYVEVRSEARYGDGKIRYMESDTGSGSIYDEHRLCATYDTAMDVARLQCAEHNAKLDAKPSAIEARKFSSVTFDVAHVRRARDAVYRAWRGFRNLRDRIEGLLPEDPTKDDAAPELTAVELREAIETAARYADEHPDMWADDLERFITAMDKGSPEQQLEAAHELRRVLLP